MINLFSISLAVIRLCLIVTVMLSVEGCSSSERAAVIRSTSAVGTALSYSPYPGLKQTIDSLLPDTLFPPANIGIKIVSMKTGETLYELNPDHLFNPASNQKLFTSAAALHYLGEDYEFETRAFIDSTADRSTIYVLGSGDPIFSVSDIDTLAEWIHRSLPQRGKWYLAGDVSKFDDLFMGSGWTWDGEPYTYSAGISPLSVNANSIEIRVAYRREFGDKIAASTVPETDYVSIANNAVIADSVRTEVSIKRKWMERKNVVEVAGDFARKDTLAITRMSVYQPEKYFLTLLSEAMRRRGVSVSEIRIDTVSQEAVHVGSLSHPIDSIVTFLNKASDNLSAESVLKTMAFEKGGKPGNAEVGTSLVYEFLNTLGIDTNKVVVADGSGLSRYNLPSANVIVQLLQSVYKSGAHFETYYHSLPIAGVDGTIDYRMKGTTAQGNLRAKTGTISGASALSGYVHTAEDELLAFSILTQHYPTSARVYRNVQDAIGVFLSSLRRGSL